MDTPVLNEIFEKIKRMPDSLQRQVKIFVDHLQVSSMHGTPGRALVEFAGSIPEDDLNLMKAAIESDCEQVDRNEW